VENLIKLCASKKEMIDLRCEGVVLSLYKECVDRLNEIFYFGYLGAQQFLLTLVLTRIIDIPELGCVSLIAKGTKTYKRLTKDHGVKIEQLGSLLQATARMLGTDRVIAENVICEALRPSKKYDFHLPGMEFYFIEENVVKRIDSRDNTKDVALIRFNEEVRNNGVPVWWGERSFAKIPAKYIDEMIIPSDKHKSIIVVETFEGLSSLPRSQAIIHGNLLDMAIALKNSSAVVHAHGQTKKTIALGPVSKGVTDVQSVQNPHPKRKSSNTITKETTHIAPQIPLNKRKKIMWELELSHEYSSGNIHKVCITSAFDIPKIVFGSNAKVSMLTQNYKIKHNKTNITKGFYTVAEVTTERGVSGKPIKLSLDYSVHVQANLV
jgi:hypothetical protein